SWRRHHHHRDLAMAAQRTRDRDILLTGAHVLERYEASGAHVVSATKGLLRNPSPVARDGGRRKVPGAIRYQPAEPVEQRGPLFRLRNVPADIYLIGAAEIPHATEA